MSTVEDAIVHAVQDSNPGAVVTGYALVVSAVVPDHDDATAFVYEAPPGQSVATTLGLFELGRRNCLDRVGSAE